MTPILGKKYILTHLWNTTQLYTGNLQIISVTGKWPGFPVIAEDEKGGISLFSEHGVSTSGFLLKEFPPYRVDDLLVVSGKGSTLPKLRYFARMSDREGGDNEVCCFDYGGTSLTRKDVVYWPNHYLATPEDVKRLKQN